MGGNLGCLVVVTHRECLPSGLISAFYISWRPGNYIMALLTRILDTWVLKSRLLYVKQYSSYPLGFLAEMRAVFKLPSRVLLFWLRILNLCILLEIIINLVHRFMGLGWFCFCFWSFSMKSEIPPDRGFPSLYFSQFLPYLSLPWSHSSSCFSSVKTSQGYQLNTVWQDTIRPWTIPYIKGGQGNPAGEKGPQKEAKEPETAPYSNNLEVP